MYSFRFVGSSEKTLAAEQNGAEKSCYGILIFCKQNKCVRVSKRTSLTESCWRDCLFCCCCRPPRKEIEMYVLLIGKFLRIHHYTVCKRTQRTRTIWFYAALLVINSLRSSFYFHSTPYHTIPHNKSYATRFITSLLAARPLLLCVFLSRLFAHLFAHCFDCASILSA